MVKYGQNASRSMGSSAASFPGCRVPQENPALSRTRRPEPGPVAAARGSRQAAATRWQQTNKRNVRQGYNLTVAGNWHLHPSCNFSVHACPRAANDAASRGWRDGGWAEPSIVFGEPLFIFLFFSGFFFFHSWPTEPLLIFESDKKTKQTNSMHRGRRDQSVLHCLESKKFQIQSLSSPQSKKATTVTKV